MCLWSTAQEPIVYAWPLLLGPFTGEQRYLDQVTIKHLERPRQVRTHKNTNTDNQIKFIGYFANTLRLKENTSYIRSYVVSISAV